MQDFSISSSLDCEVDIADPTDDSPCACTSGYGRDEPLFHGLLLECTQMHRDFADFRDPLTLHRFLANRRLSSEPLSADHIAKISEQILDALIYLHVPFKPQGVIINGSLSTSTVLIDQYMNIRMLLPSLSRSKIEKWLYSDAPELVIPNRYMTHKNVYLSTKVDIWSFGKILLSLATLGAGLSSLTRQPHFAAIYPRWIGETITRTLNLDPAERPSAIHLLHITELQRARANRLEACSNAASNAASQLVDKAISAVTEIVQEETLRRHDLEALTTALFEASATSFEAAASTDDVRTAASLLMCVHDPNVLRSTLSIARSKRSTQVLLLISNYISMHGLFATPSTFSSIPVHDETSAMKYVHDRKVRDLRKLWLEGPLPSLRHCTFNGYTALMMAASRGYDDCVEVLLNEFATESSEPSALLLAMTNSHCTCTRLLSLEVGLGGVTPLMYYASLGNVAHVNHYLESPVSKYLRCQTTTGWTALMFAAAGGFALCARMLLADEQGMQDSNGETALMKAASRNNNNIIKLFLQEESTEIGMKTLDGHTALMIAVQNNALESASLLQQYEQGLCTFSGATALMFAAKEGLPKAIDLLQPEETGMQDKSGLTALMYATIAGHANCVRLLATSETGAQDESGMTALMHAAQHGHQDCLGYLLRKEIRMQDRTGWTALMWAAQGNHAACIKEILDWQVPSSPYCALEVGFQCYEASASDSCVATFSDTPTCLSVLKDGTSEAGVQSHDGSTALMISAQKGNYLCAQLLVSLEGGIVDNSGSTALMRAAFSGAHDVVLLLLEIEARVQRQDGLTALMYAVQADMDLCVQLLIPWELGMACNGGKTALMLAAQARHPNCVRILVMGEIQEENHLYSHKCAHFDGYIMYSPSTPTATNCSLCPTVVKKETCMCDDAGWPALFYAIDNGDSISTSLLLESEGHIISSQGQTALDLALERGDPELIEIIKTKPL
ncbi:Ankyrin repeat protein [Giardia duodenalis assemblage B]|uniref:Ankyrin repeat protein n=1 Tax=Giardia duodenalis assemblage B TaxID=1394984 RepID=A0A132NYH0_GIAIN|nr:Ankyrin repeat protein [Giardia intestinalis assemblage B]